MSNRNKAELARLQEINEGKRKRFTEISGKEPSDLLSIGAGIVQTGKNAVLGLGAAIMGGISNLSDKGMAARIEKLREENEKLDELTEQARKEIGHTGNEHHA